MRLPTPDLQTHRVTFSEGVVPAPDLTHASIKDHDEVFRPADSATEVGNLLPHGFSGCALSAPGLTGVFFHKIGCSRDEPMRGVQAAFVTEHLP